MTKKPKIAVTCSFDEESGYHKIHRGYVEALADCGALPYVLTHFSNNKVRTEEIIEDVDGLLFSGGSDVDPHWFDQEPKYEMYEIVPARDALEIKLARKALDVDLPILGLCRGIQVINVAAGGKVYQDIEEQLEDTLRHRQDAPRWHPTHKIDIKSGSMLEEILEKESVGVNSFHHQSVKEIADGFIASATSSDGVIEAIEQQNGGFQLGVQWHPERMWKKHPVHKKLFKWLVEKSKR